VVGCLHERDFLPPPQRPTTRAAEGLPRLSWTVNAASLKTTVHRQPAGRSYEFVQELGLDIRMAPSLVPALAVTLDAIALD